MAEMSELTPGTRVRLIDVDGYSWTMLDKGSEGVVTALASPDVQTVRVSWAGRPDLGEPQTYAHRLDVIKPEPRDDEATVAVPVERIRYLAERALDAGAGHVAAELEEFLPKGRLRVIDLDAAQAMRPRELDEYIARLADRPDVLDIDGDPMDEIALRRAARP